MTKRTKKEIKEVFKKQLAEFVDTLKEHVSTDDSQWTIKGFIDIFKNIYTISADTKIVSKILEIHIFPKLLDFANLAGYRVILAEHQNYYPDMSFVRKDDETIKFALDLKTTYRLKENPEFCNGFTLGSHGEYFVKRDSTKNIQFPYKDYSGHFCLGIIYSRTDSVEIDETKIHPLDKLKSIVSVVRDFQFFVCEKWEIASDSSGSGNTANIGSINKIHDILNCNGVFKKLGEEWFDEYWINYGKILVKDKEGKPKKLSHLNEYLFFRGKDASLLNPKISKNIRGKRAR